MHMRNIAIVMGPCLMHAKTQSIKEIQYAPKINNATMVMLDHFDLIFGNKKEREQFISPKSDKECETGKEEAKKENRDVMKAKIDWLEEESSEEEDREKEKDKK